MAQIAAGAVPSRLNIGERLGSLAWRVVCVMNVWQHVEYNVWQDSSRV